MSPAVAPRASTLTPRQVAALPGSRRSRFFGLLKWLLPVLAAALLITIVAWPLVKAQEFSFLLAKDKVAMATERLRVANAVYRGETGKGEAFVIRAAGAVQRSSAVPIVELRDLTAKLKMADGPAVVTAPSGRYFIATDHLQINGPVRLDSTAGYSLDSATIDINLGTRIVATDAMVTGTLPIGTFRAGALRGDIQGRNMLLTNTVHLRIFGSKGRAAP